MSTARDDLVDLIRSVESIGGDDPDQPWDHTLVEAEAAPIADAILAAGWRPPLCDGEADDERA